MHELIRYANVHRVTIDMPLHNAFPIIHVVSRSICNCTLCRDHYAVCIVSRSLCLCILLCHDRHASVHRVTIVVPFVLCHDRYEPYPNRCSTISTSCRCGLVSDRDRVGSNMRATGSVVYLEIINVVPRPNVTAPSGFGDNQDDIRDSVVTI